MRFNKPQTTTVSKEKLKTKIQTTKQLVMQQKK